MNLPRTTLYNLGDEGWARIFYNLAKQNQRERMFEVAGKHTFFFPVDSAFEVDTSFSRIKLKEPSHYEHPGYVPAALFELYRVHLQGNCTNITLDVRALN